MTVLASRNPVPIVPGPRGTVLMVANYAPDVGFAWWLMERFWARLAALARAQGFLPVVAFTNDGPLPQSLIDAGVATVVHRVATTGVGRGETVRLMRRLRVRLVYFTDRAHATLAYARFRSAGVRVIVTHDHTPGDRPPVHGLRGWLKRAWNTAPLITGDRRLCVSPLILERSVRHARIPKARLAVVQNGIAPVDCSEARGRAHAVFGIPPNRRICMTVARANPYKRIDFVIEVARRYVHERGRADLAFVFCGDGPDMDRLTQLVRDADLHEWFILAGRRGDVRELLCSADFALHPSTGEAFSLAIVEYMSAGLVTIVPDIPTVCQAIESGANGIVYPDGDADAVLASLTTLMDHPADRRAIGASATRTVNERYSQRGMDAAFDEVMAPLLEQAAR